MITNKNSAIPFDAETAQELHQLDQTLIEQHKEYILRLATSNNDPVAISLYLQKHDIDIRISTLRSFLLHH